MSRRRVLVVGTLVWACVGAAVAFSALGSVNADARWLVGGASVVGPLAAGGASLLLTRHADRMAGLLLLVSVLTPTYFAYALNVPALVGGVALLVAPRWLLPSRSGEGWHRHQLA